MLKKIISGGQSGVDRAALDVAIFFNIPHGGWCPKGRLAEMNTIIPEKYQLKETITSNFEERTLLNIQDSDATLILISNRTIQISDGTNLTIHQVKKQDKPYLVVYLSDKVEIIISEINAWFTNNFIEILNIAGPRESQYHGMYGLSFKLLSAVINQTSTSNFHG